MLKYEIQINRIKKSRRYINNTIQRKTPGPIQSWTKKSSLFYAKINTVQIDQNEYVIYQN